MLAMNTPHPPTEISDHPRSIKSHLCQGELIGLAVVALTCWLWMVQTGDCNYLAAFFWSLRLVVALTVWGRLVAVLLGWDRYVSRSVPFTLTVGFIVLSTILTASRMLLGAPVAPLAETLFFIGIALYLAYWNKIADWQIDRATQREVQWVVLLCCLGSTAWTRYFRPNHVFIGDEVLFKFIRDYFFHAQAITVLSWDTTINDPGLFGLAGAPYPLYHYCGYALPAWGSISAEMCSLDMCFAFLLPFCFLMIGLTGALLASEWFGWRSAIVVTIVLSVLPDTTLIGTLVGGEPTFGLYSFQRLLHFAPANGFGIVVAGLSLFWITIAIRENRLVLALQSHALMGLALFFKAQVFIAASLLLFIVDLCFLRSASWRKILQRPWAIILFALLVGVGGVFVGWFTIDRSLWERVPTIALAWPLGYEFSEFLLWHTRDDRVAHFIALQSVENSGIVGLLWRIILLLFLPLRLPGTALLFTAILVSNLHSSTRRQFATAYLIPKGIVAGAIITYLILALVLGPDRPGYAWGHPWNYQHVPFAWMYFLLIIWAVGMLTRSMPQTKMTVQKLGLLGCFSLAPAILLGGKAIPDPGLTAAEWNNFTIPRGLVECALYLRQNSKVNELIQDSDDDGTLVVEALAQRRSYVGWPVVTTYTSKTALNDVFESRVREHVSFKQSSDPETMRSFIEQSKLRWYLLSPTSDVPWRKYLSKSVVFERDGYQVIDLARLLIDMKERQ